MQYHICDHAVDPENLGVWLLRIRRRFEMRDHPTTITVENTEARMLRFNLEAPARELIRLSRVHTGRVRHRREHRDGTAVRRHSTQTRGHPAAG
jgi:hypothetical protein